MSMRSVFIQKPLEFRLEVPLETAVQGQPVPCTLTVKNHGAEPAPLPQLSLVLGLGVLKKVKAKAEDAFEILDRARLDRAQVVVPGGQIVSSWEFTLDRNAPISDKNQNGYTIVKYKAPDLRKFSLVEEILIAVRSVEDALEVVYTFKVKKIDATATTLNFKKGKAEVTQTWMPQDYLFGGGFIRQEFVERMLDEAFSVVATGF